MDKVLLLNTSPEALQTNIAAAVVAAIKPIISIANEPRLVDGIRLAELLSISKPTVDRLVRDRKIPSVKVGRRRLFDPRAVIARLSSSDEGTEVSK